MNKEKWIQMKIKRKISFELLFNNKNWQKSKKKVIKYIKEKNIIVINIVNNKNKNKN